VDFQKLKYPFVTPDYTVFGSQMKYGETVNGEFKGIEYLLVEARAEELWKVIPDAHRDNFFMTVMRVNAAIPPHTDSGIQSTINFYTRTDNCLTQFYRFKTDNPSTRQVHNQTDGHIFDLLDLDTTESFVAEPNTAWVLDVTKPHSVIPQNNFEERCAIVLSSKLPYRAVVELLKQTGNL
jgi:hypothetical protein